MTRITVYKSDQYYMKIHQYLSLLHFFHIVPYLYIDRRKNEMVLADKFIMRKERD